MPIKVQNNLPAKYILESENIFVMDENRAISQNIRPLKIVILNLMPLKEDTELDLLRVLSNFPIQTEITFMNSKMILTICIITVKLILMKHILNTC